ncbi:MAG: hypothetical protein WCK10_02145 [Candidatus Staskawiczbacteria bacterium]
MVTEDEEIQAKEFLKRAEIKTMKKDLSALREVDALKERDKIVKIKTLEEQRAELAKKLAVPYPHKPSVEDVLQKNAGEERIAEKDLKDYATEQERQQIFLLESQRLGFEKQIDAIDKEKDPALKLSKNGLLLKKRDWQTKLNSILDEEKKLETEQKFIIEKEQSTTIPTEKKSLEQSRWDLDKKIQDVEKKRWEVEKQIGDIDGQVGQIDKSSEVLVIEKNNLRDKVLGVDKSLRDLYSIVMAREEEKRRGQAQDQIVRREALSKARAIENENVQRQQWTNKTKIEDKPLFSNVPIPVKKKLEESYAEEERQREKFIKDIESGTEKD